MSIGDLKDTGNMGNNFPYQINVLRGLQGIINALQSGGASGSVTITGPFGQNTMNNSLPVVIASNQTGAARIPNFIRTSGAGVINTITYSLSVSNVGAANGTFLSSVIKPGETLNFNADALNNFYNTGVFAYNATGTEFIIIYNS